MTVSGANDKIFFTPNDASLTVTANSYVLTITANNDAVTLNGTGDTLVFGVANGTLSLTASNETVSITGSNDAVSITGVNDKVFFALSNDRVSVSVSNDTLSLTGSNDVVTLTEAEVRWGFFELAQGHADAALMHFDRAGAPEDLTVRYWLLLLKGRALEQLDRVDDAMTAFRVAMSVAPSAQSAALALAEALVTHHRPVEAAAIVSQSLRVVDRGVDPWVYYATPDGRFWPGITADLMKTIVQ